MRSTLFSHLVICESYSSHSDNSWSGWLIKNHDYVCQARDVLGRHAMSQAGTCMEECKFMQPTWNNTHKASQIKVTFHAPFQTKDGLFRIDHH